MEDTKRFKGDFSCDSCGHEFKSSKFIRIVSDRIDGSQTDVVKARCPKCRASCLRETVVDSVSMNKPKFPLLAKEKYPGTNQTMIRRHRLNENPEQW